MSEINPSRQRGNTDSMEEHTASPSDESNKSSRGRKGSDSSYHSNPDGRSNMGIMIFGKEWSEKSHVGNVILGSYAFESQETPNQCIAAEELVDGKHLTVVLTPNLISSQLTQEDLHRRMKECVSLCGPGPQAYILVAQPQDLTEDDHKSVETILTSVVDQALERTIVVKFLPEDEDEEKDEDGVCSSVDDNESDALRSLIQACGGECYRFNRKHEEEQMQADIREKIDNIMDEFHDASDTFQQQSQKPNPEIVSSSSKHDELKEKEKKSLTSKIFKSKSPKAASLPPMNLMLFGRKGIQRTSIGNIILSQSYSKLNFSSNFLKRQADVCGYTVTLVEVPSLHTMPLSQEKLLQKSLHSISQCAPGINAFLLALPRGHFTDEDKEELQMIHSIFGPRVNDYIMILYTNVSCPKGKPVQDSLQENTNLEQQFPKGCFVLSQEGGHEEISEMLKQIKDNSDKCFTADMFVEAQIGERGRLRTELEKKNKKIEEMKQLNSSAVIQNPDSTPYCVRILLIGKTGVGKSATANTILGKPAFKSKAWGKSVTTLCQKDTTQENGRLVAVVDTPGLFDTDASNEDVKKEILKCFSLLAPGPHVFLVILSIGRMTPEEKETLKLLKDIFGTRAEKFTITLFTRGDDLDTDTTVQQYINSDRAIEQLISDCEGRYHVFNNKNKENRKQVAELMEIIDRMVEKNGVGCYTNEMFQMAEAAIKEKCDNMMRERELEVKREKKQLQAEFDEKIRAMKDEKTREIQREREERDRQQRETEKYIITDRQRRERREREEREAEDKMRRDKEEIQRQSWTRTLEEVERKHKEQKEAWEMEHKKQLKEEKERAAKEQEEWLERQRKERSEFERRQEAERRRRDEEERSRKEKEELERQKLEARVKDAEKLTAEIRKERMKQLREWEEERMKEKQNEQNEREEWERLQKKMKEDFETEKERARKERDYKEEARREQERKERERMENEHAEKIKHMKHAQEKQEKEWAKEREEETERRQKEDEESRKKIKELHDEFERENEKEKKRRKKEDEDREEEHKKKLKEIEEQNQNKIEMLIKKHEDEVRKKAEELNEFTKDLKGIHSLEQDELRKRMKEWEEKSNDQCVLL